MALLATPKCTMRVAHRPSGRLALSLVSGQVGVGEVGGAADQLGQAGAIAFQQFVGVLAGGQALVSLGEGRQRRFPALGQLTRKPSSRTRPLQLGYWPA